MRPLLALILCALTASANQVSTRAVDWRADYDRWPFALIIDNPEGGFQFNWAYDGPSQTWGEVHYLLSQFTPDFTPVAVEMTFRLESSPDVQYVSVQVPEVPAQVRPILMATTSAGCSPNYDSDPTNPIPCQYRSWWAHSTSYVLGSADGKTFTLRVPLQPELWSSVYGVRGDNSGGWFDVAMQNIKMVGFTFGGQYFGHGVRLNSGSATFKLLGYRLIPDEIAPQ